jgi:hypothetical protein
LRRLGRISIDFIPADAKELKPGADTAQTWGARSKANGRRRY